MPEVSAYVPFSAIFPGEKEDFEAFRDIVRTLSRTDTLFWCARLSLILSNPQNKDEVTKQGYGIRHFFDLDEHKRGLQYAKDHGNPRPFFREQLLELIRWTCLLAEDQPGDGNTFADADVRRQFLRAALLASDIWGRHAYPDGLQVTGDRLADRRRAMLAMRNGVTVVPPDIMRILVRGDGVYRAFREHFPGADARFVAVTGLTLEQYSDCLVSIAVFFGSIYPEKVTPENFGGILIENVRRQLPVDMHVPFERYIALESQTAEELRKSLWGDNGAGDVVGTEPFDTLPLRARPLLRAPGSRAIILDLVFCAERAVAGPLFILVDALRRGHPEKDASQLFGAFGKAFEAYINGILRSMYPPGDALCDRLLCNPKAVVKGRVEEEFADACINDVTEAVLFETKGVFVRENASRSIEAYQDGLREKYGDDGDKKRGAAQLGRWIKRIALGEAVPTVQDWSRVGLIYPVLVAHDERVDRPGHAEFFLKEFAKALESDQDLPMGYAKKGRFTVAPLTVMTIDDVELLESSVKFFRLTDLLKDYAHATHNGVRVSLHDFMVAVEGKRYKFSISRLAERSLGLLAETRGRMFPNMPFPLDPSM